MKIIPIDYGESVLPESMVFSGGKKDVFRPIKFIILYIEDEDRRIIVDAGCDTMPGFEMKNFIGPVQALKKNGIDPEDISDVVITHAHHDHIEGVRHFPNALIHIHEDELENATKYLKATKCVNVINGDYPLTRVTKIVKIGGHSKGSCIVEIDIGEKTVVFVGDECYAKECLDKTIPTGSSCNKEASLEFVKKYSNTSKYITLLAHEETAFAL